MLNSNCPDLKLVARGKVRDLYEVDEKSLLFVATDRISAFDVIMKNVSIWILKRTIWRGRLLTEKGETGIMHASSSLHPLSSQQARNIKCVYINQSIPGKGKILTEISLFWFDLLKDVLPNHLITANFDEMPEKVQKYREQLDGRSILVKKMRVVPIEAIVRGYITGSGWSEYKKKGTICDIPLPKGLVESEKLPEVLFTPSTKAEIGDHGKQ